MAGRRGRGLLIAEMVVLRHKGRIWLRRNEVGKGACFAFTVPLARVPACEGGMHLYQEIAPVHPRVVSSLCPADFYDFLYDPAKSMVTVPALCFVELTLGGLAADPRFGSAQGLPYADIDHYRECLLELDAVEKTAPVKIVDRIHKSEFHFRTIKSGSGFYLGSGPDLLFFPMPTIDEVHTTYYQWWRSAQM